MSSKENKARYNNIRIATSSLFFDSLLWSISRLIIKCSAQIQLPKST